LSAANYQFQVFLENVQMCIVVTIWYAGQQAAIVMEAKAALLFACANAVFDKVINSFINAANDNVDFWATLAKSVITAPLKLLSSRKSQDDNIDGQIKSLTSFLSSTDKRIENILRMVDKNNSNSTNNNKENS
ncbi:hypothetical protein DOY81_003200, partial [Sarcophaga bullata]